METSLLSDVDLDGLEEDTLNLTQAQHAVLMGQVTIGEVVRVFDQRIVQYQELLKDTEASQERRALAAGIVALRNLRDEFVTAGTNQEKPPEWTPR